MISRGDQRIRILIHSLVQEDIKEPDSSNIDLGNNWTGLQLIHDLISDLHGRLIDTALLQELVNAQRVVALVVAELGVADLGDDGHITGTHVVRKGILDRIVEDVVQVLHHRHHGLHLLPDALGQQLGLFGVDGLEGRGKNAGILEGLQMRLLTTTHGI